jgi:NAD(P)-dependent dehydrogenase (short-subunit alcohol dehydrogenase family)
MSLLSLGRRRELHAMDHFRLTGRIALITGAGSGIGEAIAQRFAREGAQVVVTDIDENSAYQVSQAIASKGGKAVHQQLDVSDSTAVSRVVDAIVAENQRLDIMVANAALTGEAACLGPVMDLTDEQWDHVMAVNLSGVFYCARSAAQVMITRRSGCIITIGSVNNFVPKPHATAYAVAKGGVLLLTKSLARDLGPLGIRVNGIAPGSTYTPKVVAMSQASSDAHQERYARVPLGRFAEPSEIAAVAAFLASDDASYVHGEMVRVDGGHLCT